MANAILYTADGFNDKLRELIAQFVQDDDDVRCFIKVMVMIQEQGDANHMDFVAQIAVEFAYERSKKHAERSRAYIKSLKAELLAEFAEKEA